MGLAVGCSGLGVNCPVRKEGIADACAVHRLLATYIPE